MEAITPQGGQGFSGYSSFDEFFARYEGQVFNFMRRLIGAEKEAEEVLSRFYSKASAGFSSTPSDENVLLWFFRNALEVAVERIRELYSGDSLVVEESWGEATPSAVVPGMGTEALEGVIAQLPLEYRQVFLLRDVEGFSCAEVAEILARPVDEVRALIHRARLMTRRVIRRASPQEIAANQIFTESADLDRDNALV